MTTAEWGLDFYDECSEFTDKRVFVRVLCRGQIANSYPAMRFVSKRI